MAKKKKTPKAKPLPPTPPLRPQPQMVCVPVHHGGGPMHDPGPNSSPAVVIRNIETLAGEEQHRNFGIHHIVPIFDTYEDYVAWVNAPFGPGDVVLVGVGWNRDIGVVVTAHERMCDVKVLTREGADTPRKPHVVMRRVYPYEMKRTHRQLPKELR